MAQSYYDMLMELVMDDDNSEVFNESVLTKMGITKDDLQNPDKVKKCLTKLNGITSEYEKRSAIIGIFSAMLQGINGLIGVFGKLDKNAKIANVMIAMLIQIITEAARYNFGVSDYRKLLNKVDNEIKKVTNKISKLDVDKDKETIKQLEEIRENLRKSKDEIIKRMKAENKVEGKNEPINPEAQSPIAAFTGLINY